jgi:hypothetical protein
VKFEQFENICCDDEKARLDNLANQLRIEPGAKAYVFFYGGRRHIKSCSRGTPRLPRRGEGEARAARLKPYILNAWPSLDPDRIVIVNGGYRERWEAEIWIVPKGANPPAPSPTVKPQVLRFRRGRIGKREYHCYV